MNYPKQIRLSNEAVLHIEAGIVTCFDRNLHQFELTRGQQKMLHKLADNINHPLPMSILYEAYTGEATPNDSRGIRDNVAKMKNTLPNCIKTAIKSVRGYGYKLIGSVEDCACQGMVMFHQTPNQIPVNDSKAENINEPLLDLVGDYYGYYLDPLGTSAVLGAYLHIERADDIYPPKLAAYAVLGIRSDHIFLSNEIEEIFHQTGQKYKDAYKEYKQTLDSNDRRCYWGQGDIDTDENLVIITLITSDTGARWEIIIDLYEYLERQKYRENENDFYRGGMGLALVSRDIHGTFCLRLGLIRKTRTKQSVSLSTVELRNKLKISDDSKDAVWKPIKLSRWIDKLWYDWIMNS